MATRRESCVDAARCSLSCRGGAKEGGFVKQVRFRVCGFVDLLHPTPISLCQRAQEDRFNDIALTGLDSIPIPIWLDRSKRINQGKEQKDNKLLTRNPIISTRHLLLVRSDGTWQEGNQGRYDGWISPGCGRLDNDIIRCGLVA